MPKTDTARMFARMLAAAPVVPAEVHRTAWRYANQAGLTDLKKTLIARADAPDDLVVEYATLTSPELRGVYLGRKDVTDDQVAAGVSGERRASVLADALVRSNQHPAVVAAAAEVFIAKPTKALVDQMRRLPAHRITPALAEAIIVVDDRLDPNDRSRWHKLRKIAANLGPDRAERVITQVSHPSVVAAIIGHDIGDDLVVETLDRVVPGVLKRTTDEKTVGIAVGHLEDLILAARAGRSDNPAISQAFTKVLSGYYGETIKRLRDRATVAPQRPPAFAPWALGAGDETRTVIDPSELAQPGHRVDVTQAPLEQLPNLAASLDRDVVAQVAGLVHTIPASVTTHRFDVVKALLWNPLLCIHDRHRLLNLIRVTPESWNGMSLFDAVVWFPEDQVALDIWCEVFPSTVLEAHGWDPFGGHHRAETLVPRWAASERAQDKNATRIALGLGVNADTLEKLPFAALRTLWSDSRQRASDMTLITIAQMLAESFGDDANAWALFATVKEGFTGTFGELLTTCRAAAA